ncbi:hypothetical protein HPB51_004951 [Rhipicephalus microplus]|uniref:Sin3 histone deacetylase corepressor complex component SDS3 n=1 Tax=Rhipicephalus microplus TaxID=6941 RepID=A0A9J6EXE2_RHIMP|nr:hypothetical protein HPB51_004951 [Rhipicephalus microplus]
MYLQDLADFASMHKESGNDVDYDDNSIDCDDLLDHDDRDSDEDTEDASETDMVKQREEECTEIKEQMYRDKLAMLKKQLTQLKEETHPEYLKRLRKIEQLYQERLFLNEVFQSHEVERVEREYLHEKKAAVREFEEKKIDLRESLIMDLEEKRRAIEAERSTVELTGGEEYGNMDHGSHAIEARIEDGKLFYERKCYQRGQSVCVDSKDMGRFFGVISGVGTSEFWVKKTSDSGKVKIHLSQLLKGKVILRRKSAC